jgi:hypothetical protein
VERSGRGLVRIPRNLAVATEGNHEKPSSSGIRKCEEFYLLGYNVVQSVEKPTDVSEEHFTSIFEE